MFYVAKTFQALGIADVGYALFVAINQGRSMADEIVLTLIGVGKRMEEYIKKNP